MDYEKMSDFEINKAVAKKEGLLVKEVFDIGHGFTEDYHSKYPSTIWTGKLDEFGVQCEPWDQKNYCSSWTDMGPIIEREGIIVAGHGMACRVGESDLYENITHCDMKPLRAAAIVYLKMEK